MHAVDIFSQISFYCFSVVLVMAFIENITQ